MIALLAGFAAASDAPLLDDPVRVTPVVRAVEAVAPAVVSITTEQPTYDPFGGFFGRRPSSQGAGSGVVIYADGIVLTNAHVVDQATAITATFPDGTTFPATILGIAPELDLAVLRLAEATELPAVELGTSSGLLLGEPVIAIGNPLGLGHTVTTGIVSAIGRPIETSDRVYQDFIQTDTAINPGNSGGPLLDGHGRLIGINTAIRPDGQNIGFAIPVDRAMKVANDLVNFGTVQTPWLGVDLADVRLRAGGTAARVEWVYAKGSPLQQGDVIYAVDGRSVQGRADLNALLATYEPGDKVTLAWYRDGDERSGSVKGGKLPDEVVDLALSDVLGVTVADNGQLTAVTSTGSFGRNGLRAGDWIVAFNGERIESLEQLRAAIARAKSGHRPSATFTVRRGQRFGRFNFQI